MLDRHVSYLASKINFIDEDISAMMIASRLKKDSYQGLSVPEPAGKYVSAFTARLTAGDSWHELGMLTLLALLSLKHKNLPTLLASNKRKKILTRGKALTHTHARVCK